MTKLPNEINVQEEITRWLQENDISPFNLTFTFSENTGGLLGVTFFIPQDVSEFLNLLDYKVQCDKSGFEVYEENNTVILHDLALIQLFSVLK